MQSVCRWATSAATQPTAEGIDFVEFPGPRGRRRVALILGISRVAKCRAFAFNN